MKLICPTCGATASLEAWSNDASCRMFMDSLMKLPREVQGRALEYLGLFRPGSGKGLSWGKALRIMTELAELVAPGRIRWDGSEERPAPPDLWGRAMEAVLSRKPEALKNHNYLRHTAWSMADKLAASAEREKEGAARRRPPEEPRPERVPLVRPGPTSELKLAYSEQDRIKGLQRIKGLKANIEEIRRQRNPDLKEKGD